MPMTLKLGMQHRVLEYYHVCSNDDHRLILSYLRQGQIWPHVLLYGEKGKQLIKKNVVCDIKVGRCSQLNEFMNLYEYQRSRSFTDTQIQHYQTSFL